jgi:exodeoxyribonuclease VII large subunit
MNRPARQAVVRPAPTPAKPKPANLLTLPSVDPLATGTPSRGLSLSHFLNGVKTSLQQTHETPTWIEAELAFAQAKQHFWALGLQETDEQGSKVAATEAVVWAQDIAQVIDRFEAQTGQSLAAGMKVLLQVQVQFSAQWGFRLVCKDISPQWTMGEAAVQREQLRQQLMDEGLWKKNQDLPEPSDFTSVAVVAPHASAGLEDFLREAERLEGLGLCKFHVFHAPFEGPNAVIQLPLVIDQAGQETGIDALCLVRGGGAAAGIAWLNHEAIVRAVARLRVPLITGIGHERDVTLVEELAALPAGTPSKAIGLIVGRIVQQAQQAKEAWSTVQRLAHDRIQQADQRLSHHRQEMTHLSQRLVSQARQSVDSLAREALGLGPQATLNRGYALVTNENGQILTQVPQATNLKVSLRFQDGSVDAVLSPSKPSRRSRSQNPKPSHD